MEQPSILNEKKSLEIKPYTSFFHRKRIDQKTTTKNLPRKKKKTFTGRREETDVIGEDKRHRRIWRTAIMRHSRFSFSASSSSLLLSLLRVHDRIPRARCHCNRIGVHRKREGFLLSFGRPLKARSLMGPLLITLIKIR